MAGLERKTNVNIEVVAWSQLIMFFASIVFIVFVVSIISIMFIVFVVQEDDELSSA